MALLVELRDLGAAARLKPLTTCPVRSFLCAKGIIPPSALPHDCAVVPRVVDQISLVIPCLEMALDYGYGDLQAPQGVPQPSPLTAQAHSAEGAAGSSTPETSAQGQAAPSGGWLPRAFKTHFW